MDGLDTTVPTHRPPTGAPHKPQYTSVICIDVRIWYKTGRDVDQTTLTTMIFCDQMVSMKSLRLNRTSPIVAAICC